MCVGGGCSWSNRSSILSLIHQLMHSNGLVSKQFRLLSTASTTAVRLLQQLQSLTPPWQDTQYSSTANSSLPWLSSIPALLVKFASTAYVIIYSLCFYCHLQVTKPSWSHSQEASKGVEARLKAVPPPLRHRHLRPAAGPAARRGAPCACAGHPQNLMSCLWVVIDIVIMLGCCNSKSPVWSVCRQERGRHSAVLSHCQDY